jgi:hypothetical protein
MSELNDGLKNALSERVQSNGVYAKPAIVCELDLETRAGTPLGLSNGKGLDPLGLDPSNNPR